MKKIWLATGAIAGLLVLSVAVVRTAQNTMREHQSCQAIRPTLQTYNDHVFSFYDGLYARTMQPTEARQLARLLGQRLPQLAAVQVQDPTVAQLHKDLLAAVQVTPARIRQWAETNPSYADYIAQRAKQSGRAGLQTDGATEYGRLMLHCGYEQ